MRIIIGKDERSNNPRHIWCAAWHFEFDEREQFHIGNLSLHFAPTPQEAVAALLAAEPFHQQLPPGVSPVDTVRDAVRVIWGEADALDASRENTRRMDEMVRLLNRYTSDRGRLLAAAVRHSTGLGLNFSEVGALMSAYDAGLELLRKAAPE